MLLLPAQNCSSTPWRAKTLPWPRRATMRRRTAIRRVLPDGPG